MTEIISTLENIIEQIIDLKIDFFENNKIVSCPDDFSRSSTILIYLDDIIDYINNQKKGLIELAGDKI